MIGAAVQKDPITPDKCQCCGAVNPEFPNSTSPFCVKCALRKRCPAQSPLSGYEPVYIPRLYNAKKYTQHNHNCFAYAFDIMDLPTAEECNGNDKEECKVPFHQPGYFSGQKHFDESGEKRCFDLFTRLKSDMPAIEIARNGRPIYFTDKPAKGYSKIALVIDPKQDYHFYRQDSNGFWSHKPGGTPVKNKDTSGRLIYNPELANRDSRDDAENNDGLNYNVFCGFMCVPRLLPNQAKRGGGSLSGPKRGGGGGKDGNANVLTRKLRRLVGGMNNQAMENNGNGYNPNKENKSRAKTKTRTYKLSKPVKAAKARGALPLPNDPNMAVRKMMAIVNKLKSTYSDIEITKDDEKAFRDIARSSALPKYNPGKLFGMIQKKYGRVNTTIASEVRGIFRSANFLPMAGATTSKAPRPTGSFVSRISRKPQPTINRPVNVPNVKRSTLKYNRARRAAERAEARALALLEAARKPRKARLAAAANPVDEKTEVVLDIIQETKASPAEITRAITFAEHLREAQRMHSMPPAPTNPLESSMADLFGALEEAAAESSVVPVNNNINGRVGEGNLNVRENREDDELTAAMKRLGF